MFRRAKVRVMTNRRVVRVLAAVFSAAMLSGIGVPPASGSTSVAAVEASGTSTRTAGSLPPLSGYYLASTDGGVFAFGNARFYGSMAGRPLSAPIVAIASTPTSQGYWLLTAAGQVFAFGDAEPFLSPLKGLGSPVVDLDLTGIGPTVANAGELAQSANYDRSSWGTRVVNSTGATLIPSGESEVQNPPFGPLVAPIVAVVTLNRSTFWLASADGGVFTLPYFKDGVNIVGTLKFYGSMGGKPLNAPVVDIVGTPVRDGYLLAAADGGVFAFGNAPFLGSMAGKPLAAPIVGMS